jgi:hypothetical protein
LAQEEINHDWQRKACEDFPSGVVDRVPVALFLYYIKVNEMLGADAHVPRRAPPMSKMKGVFALLVAGFGIHGTKQTRVERKPLA